MSTHEEVLRKMLAQREKALDCATSCEADKLMPELAALRAALLAMKDARRYRWLRNGGWEVAQHPKYWENVSSFDEAIIAAMTGVAIDAAMAQGEG